MSKNQAELLKILIEYERDYFRDIIAANERYVSPDSRWREVTNLRAAKSLEKLGLVEIDGRSVRLASNGRNHLDGK